MPGCAPRACLRRAAAPRPRRLRAAHGAIGVQGRAHCRLPGRGGRPAPGQCARLAGPRPRPNLIIVWADSTQAECAARRAASSAAARRSARGGQAGGAERNGRCRRMGRRDRRAVMQGIRRLRPHPARRVRMQACDGHRRAPANGGGLGADAAGGPSARRGACRRARAQVQAPSAAERRGAGPLGVMSRTRALAEAIDTFITPPSDRRHIGRR